MELDSLDKIMKYGLLVCFVGFAVISCDETYEDLCTNTKIQKLNNPLLRISKNGRNVYTGPVEGFNISGETVIFIDNQEVKTALEQHYIYTIFLNDPEINDLSIDEIEAIDIEDIEIGDLSLLEPNHLKKINGNYLQRTLEDIYIIYKRECKSDDTENVTKGISKMKKVVNDFKISLGYDEKNAGSKVFPSILVTAMAIIFLFM